jgi:hypothetical protein
VLDIDGLKDSGALPGDRVRSHCRFVLTRIHFTPDSLTNSVPLFLNRQCDRARPGESAVPELHDAVLAYVQTRAYCHSSLSLVVTTRTGILHTNENEGGIMTEGPRLSWPTVMSSRPAWPGRHASARTLCLRAAPPRASASCSHRPGCLIGDPH